MKTQISGQIRHSDKFKIDAVAQVTERGYSVKDVTERLKVSTKSLYTCMAQFSKPHRQTDQQAEVRRLKKELARVTELPRSHSSLPGRGRCQIRSRQIHLS